MSAKPKKNATFISKPQPAKPTYTVLTPSSSIHSAKPLIYRNFDVMSSERPQSAKQTSDSKKSSNKTTDVYLASSFKSMKSQTGKPNNKKTLKKATSMSVEGDKSIDTAVITLDIEGSARPMNYSTFGA